MLVITRKPGEGIVVAGNIKITVLEAGKDRVRIGVDAPQEVRIVRGEVFDTERQNLEAAGTAFSEEALLQLLGQHKLGGTAPGQSAPAPDFKRPAASEKPGDSSSACEPVPAGPGGKESVSRDAEGKPAGDKK